MVTDEWMHRNQISELRIWYLGILYVQLNPIQANANNFENYSNDFTGKIRHSYVKAENIKNRAFTFLTSEPFAYGRLQLTIPCAASWSMIWLGATEFSSGSQGKSNE